MARAFIDMETPRFEAHSASFPDPYALKRVSPEGFAAAILPAIPPPREGQHAPMGLGDLFFDPGDPLHPDADDEDEDEDEDEDDDR